MKAQRLLRAAESARAVDRPAGTAARSVQRALDATGTGALLRGSWLGHPVHPLLVTIPIGAWVCSAVLEVGFGQRVAAQRLVGVGLLATAPTVIAGVADFAGLDVEQRRVAVLHAGTNAVSAGCFLASYVFRGRGAYGAGTAWSALGLLGIGVGGALGGHLSYALGAGVHRWQNHESSSTTTEH
jgi:uncharacterized membrane protein